MLPTGVLSSSLHSRPWQPGLKCGWHGSGLVELKPLVVADGEQGVRPFPRCESHGKIMEND